MLKNRLIPHLFIVGCSLLQAEGAPGFTFSSLDKYQTPVPYADERDWEVTQNLGATGARAWIEGRKGNTRNSREIVIKSVTPGSPAHGFLEPYDIIIGMDDVRFTSDARMTFARALTKAEGTEAKGKLKLLCVRNGETKNITVTVPIMGDFSSTAPFSCPKTTKIIQESTEFLNTFGPDAGFDGLPGATNALLLLAAQNPAHLDLVRRSAMNMGPNHEIKEHYCNTWTWGYVNMFLCEYYLATGDGRVLPSIGKYTKRLVEGQVNPGTWGHKVMADDMPPGYGLMNQSGLVCFISLILADQCGVEFNRHAMERSIRYYGRFVDWGGIGYGDHEASKNASSNGKNGSAAVAFHLLGAHNPSQWFAHMAASTNQDHFETGHTGNIWGKFWTPIGASLTGTSNYIKFWARFNSLRDLARYWKGGFLSQSQPHLREGTMGVNHTQGGPMYATGRYALGYLARSRALAILGRRDSVFGTNPPTELHSALEQYRSRSFEKSIQLATAHLKSQDLRLRTMAGQLKQMAELNLKSIEITLTEIDKNVKVGDLFLAQHQLEALEGLLKEKDERISSLKEVITSPESTSIIRSRGHLYQRIIKGFSVTGPKGFWKHPLPPSADEFKRRKLPELLRSAKGFYREQAEKAQKVFGETAKSHTLFKSLNISEKEPEKRIDFKVSGVKKFRELRAIWNVKGQMVVKLNGRVILDLYVPKGYKSREIILKQITLELLKEGNNTLTVTGKSVKGLSGAISLVAIEG
jgi:hypothetical protein